MQNLDEKSKERAIRLFGSEELALFEVGTTQGLKQIHSYLFKELYDFAGKIREKNISKGGFRFASCLYLSESLKTFEVSPPRKSSFSSSMLTGLRSIAFK